MSISGESSPEAKKAMRRQVLGAKPHFSDQASPELEMLESWSEDAVWGVWSRPGLDIRARCIVTVATLAALNRPDILRVHLIAAHRNGVSIEELREILLQHAVYAGIASGTDAMRVLISVAGELQSQRDQHGK